MQKKDELTPDFSWLVSPVAAQLPDNKSNILRLAFLACAPALLKILCSNIRLTADIYPTFDFLALAHRHDEVFFEEEISPKLGLLLQWRQRPKVRVGGAFLHHWHVLQCWNHSVLPQNFRCSPLSGELQYKSINKLSWDELIFIVNGLQPSQKVHWLWKAGHQ